MAQAHKWGAGANPGFGSGGPAEFCPQGGSEPAICQNRGFPLKLRQNCMLLKKSWGQGGPGPRPPVSATGPVTPFQIGKMCNKILIALFSVSHFSVIFSLVSTKGAAEWSQTIQNIFCC